MRLKMNNREIDVNDVQMLDGYVWIKEAVWLDTLEYLNEEELEQLHEDSSSLHYYYYTTQG